MRLLDQFGRPYPDAADEAVSAGMAWLNKATMKQYRESLEIQRVLAIRDALGMPMTVGGAEVGDTIRIRLPERFQKDQS